MVTMIYKSKNIYKHFNNVYEAQQYLIDNGISYHFVMRLKWGECVKHSRWYRFITVIEFS